MSSSRSPGRPTASGSRRPSACTTVTSTFLSVSAASHGRSGRGYRASASATRVAMVGVPGVSSTWAGGRRRQRPHGRHRRPDRLDVGGPAAGGAAGEGVLADLQRAEELLAPAAAHGPRHGRHHDVVEPQPVEGGDVGAAVRLVDRSRPASSTSKEYESFITNSRPRSRPARGRASSRYLVWIW